jgi:hypothetical protein
MRFHIDAAIFGSPVRVEYRDDARTLYLIADAGERIAWHFVGDAPMARAIHDGIAAELKNRSGEKHVTHNIERPLNELLETGLMDGWRFAAGFSVIEGVAALCTARIIDPDGVETAAPAYLRDLIDGKYAADVEVDAGLRHPVPYTPAPEALDRAISGVEAAIAEAVAELGETRRAVREAAE